jgi:hypothetical protein
MRWHYRDPLLVWLLPAAYGLHILEEWFGGFPEWLALVTGSALPRSAFIAINAVAFAGMVLATLATARRESNGWMGIAISTILLINGVAHVLGSLVTGRYSPGLITGVVLYVPLAQLALMRAWQQADREMFVRGVVTGAGIHVLVFVVAYALSAASDQLSAFS